MKRKFSYSILEMNCRLLAIGRPIRKYIVISTLASIFGALAHMGLMGFGALWLLAAAGYCRGTVIYAALTVLCAALISLCRYLEGVFSHQGAYGILAKMRVHLFDAIDRVSPAYLIGRETGDVMNVAVSDIETLEFFFAHTIGPMFTVILLPVTTVVLAWRVSPLYAWVLIPIYILISIVLPLIALKAGRGIGMRYRERLGTLKSKILESVYSIRDIQIFGAGPRKMQEVAEANRQVNRAALGLTLHRQTIASLPSFFVSLARILILVCAGVLASRGADDPVGTVAVSFAATASLSSTFNLTFVVTSLLEAYAAAERIFKIEDALPETEEPAHSTPCGEIETIEFRDVSFAYPHTDRQILEHFSYVIHKGDRIGIAGESGVGKSTILWPAAAVLRPLQRRDLHQRRASGADQLRGTPPAHRLPGTGYLPVQRDHRRKYRPVQAGSHHGRNSRRGGKGRRGRIHRHPAGGLSDGHGPDERPAFGGRTPANRHRPHPPAQSRRVPDGRALQRPGRAA